MAIGYASPADLQRLSLNSSFLQTISLADQSSALEAASDLIDGYLAGNFTLPLRSWGQDLVRCNCCIARYDLAVRRGYNPEAGADLNLRSLYDDCMKWLEGVRDGDITPNVVDSASGPSPFVITSSQRGWTSRGNATPADDTDPFQGDGDG